MKLWAKARAATPVAAQTVGCVFALYGVFLLIGPKWTLVTAGLVLVALGTLFEWQRGR